MTKNDITIGRLIGQMESVQKSLDSLHKKFDLNSNHCSECREDIRQEAQTVATAAAKDAVKSVKLWIVLAVMIAFAAVAEYLFQNHFMPDVQNTTEIESRK
jgi:uncharacterized membrane protein YqgA involved in biofilm formation